MSNIEIEIRVKIISSDNNLDHWLKNNAKFVSTKEQEDTYYEPVEHSFLYTDNNGKQQADKWLRIRSSSNENSVCYKMVHRDKDGNFIYANEHETTVGDTQTMKDVLTSLNYKELCTVSKKRMLWTHSNYYICIDRVFGLGDFVEVEIVNSSKNIKIEEEKIKMLNFIKTISSSEVEKVEGGYPWLLMKKNNINSI